MPAARAARTLRRSGLLLGLAVTLAVTLPMGLGLVSAGEGRVYDLLLRARSDKPSPKVVLVGIDDPTFQALGGRNPDRTEIARVVDALWHKGASLVALDLLLDSPRAEGEDAALEEALKRADTVLACNPSAGIKPMDRFARQAVGQGSIEFLTDKDGILRSLPAPYEDVEGDSLRLQKVPLALECALLTWFSRGAPSPLLRGPMLFFEGHSYPVARPWLIPFCGGDGTLPRLSFVDVLRGSGIPDLRGAVVLVGNTRRFQHDYFSVPLPTKARTVSGFETLPSHTMAGVEVHGQALSALLRDASIQPPPAWARWALLGVVSLFGIALTAVPLRPSRVAVLWAGSGLAVVGGSVLSMRAGVALPALALGLAWAAYAAVSFSYQGYCEFQERRAVERLFSRYVSPNVARDLLANPDLVQLGGRRKVLTILFSDVRGFTSLSEQIPPEQVSALLNEYFTEMTKILFRFDGTLDKFIGDAILAFFGDPVQQPDHAARALACAVAMQEGAAELRERFRTEGKPQLHIGVAVNTGPVVVGNNGAENNFVYTVIGDAVNLTSRLQGLAQRDDVILPNATAELVPGFAERYRYEELEPVRVKGKQEPVSIVRVLGTVS